MEDFDFSIAIKYDTSAKTASKSAILELIYILIQISSKNLKNQQISKRK